MADDTENEPLDETDLVAFLDGELDADRAKKVEANLALDPAARAKADELRRAFDLLDYLPRTEPSPTFASRTLTQIEPSDALTGPYIPTPSTSTTVPPAPRSWWPVGWIAAAVLAGGGGYIGSVVAPLRPAKPELVFTDVAVIEKLPLYLGIDDLDFVRKLDETDLFDPDADEPALPTEVQPPPNRDKLTALFDSFPPARQRQLRELHEQFTKLDPPTRDKLSRVVERYAVWLDGLSDSDRRKVLAKPTGDDRVQEVQRMSARSIRTGLPAGIRKQLDLMPEEEDQTRLVAAYRKQEADHRDGWELARRQWDALKKDQRPWPFADAELADKIEKYVKGELRPRMTPDEFAVLDRLRSLPEVDPDRRAITASVLYAAYLYSYSDAHPIYPESGPSGKTIRTKLDAQTEYKQEIRRIGESRIFFSVPSRWPDVALALTVEARKQGITLKPPPGPCKVGEFTKELNDAIPKFEAEKLSATERKELKGLEGKWPEYPKRLMELARKYEVTLPGVPTLPGSPKLWAQYYGPVRGGRK